MRKEVLALRVNGEEVEVAIAPQRTLLELLREDLGLTGTKHGCELGECGACAVLVDGRPLQSCLVLALECEGSDVVTVEGLADGARLHPLQEAFADAGATQCGYCTPGMLMTTKALLDGTPNPSREQVKEAISGNLCRCTGYAQIVDAVTPPTILSTVPRRRVSTPVILSEAKDLKMHMSNILRSFVVFATQDDVDTFFRGAVLSREVDEGPHAHRTAVIGHPRRRVDARAKVTGRTRYADDLSFPRMLFAKLLRSQHPHALLRNIDIARAAAAPGVHAVLTGRDFPINYGILPVSQDEEPLCREKVRFVGDPIAAVIASTEEEATAALALIDVEYELLKTIADPAEALATNEPRIHDYGDRGNVHKAVAFEFGDVDDALAHADRVFDDTFFYAGNTHLAMEQHATVAQLDRDGKLVIHSSTQTPHYLHRALAKALALPPHTIRVVATPNGGGFGGKTDPFNHEIVVAKAAMITGRPVKICLTREEVFACHRGRHPVAMRMRTGVKNDGSLVAMDLQTLLDGGAYGSYGVASTFYTGALQTVTYHLPRYRFRGCRTFTNKPPCGPKRGHGTPQPRFGQEVQLDKIAVALGRDPADLRLQQLVAPDSLTANWMRVGTMGLRQCIENVVEGSGWRAKWQKLPFGRGVGLACSSYLCGAGLPIYWNDLPHSGVQLKLDRSGMVTLFCGATEVGQGSDDVLAAIVAEVLGVSPADIKLVTGDTDLTPVDLGSYSSRVTLMAGNAAIQAAERAKALIASAVTAKLNVPEERLVFAERRVFDAEDPEHGIAFADALILAEAMHGTLGTTGSYTPPAPAAKYKGGGVGPSPAYSYTAAIAEVDVDPEIGALRVAKIWIAHDIGRALNPLLVRGQIEGGVYMGLSEALMEEQAMRRLRSGALVLKTPSMLDYKSLTALEMPEIVTYLVETDEPNGPFGAKEVGQGPLLPIMPAIANAVFDAVGVRIDEVPITPEKILNALASAERRYGPARFPNIDWPATRHVAPPWEGA